MGQPQFLTIQCKLIGETDKAVRLHWDDMENEVNMVIWVPKKCIEEDDFDRESTIRELRNHSGLTLVNVAVWWMVDQEWFDDSIQELIDL